MSPKDEGEANLHDSIPNLGAKRSSNSDSSISQSSADHKKDFCIATLLVVCLLLVGFWEVMSSRSERPWAAFQLGAADFDGFKFECEGWRGLKRDVSPSPIEPEIMKYDLTMLDRSIQVYHAMGVAAGLARHGRANRSPSPEAQSQGKHGGGLVVRARLIHGYNMVDCMRIKGYAVTLLRDSANPSLPSLPSVNLLRSPSSHESLSNAFPFGRVQVWELENSVGDKSIWVTSMLRAGDFAVLNVSTTDMSFPRVGVPDNPDWLPTGVGWKSFRHPVRNFKLAMRSKWNGARCDPMVFLKLKQPAWADEEALTLVTNSKGRMGDEVLQGVLDAHGLLYGELVEWRRAGRLDRPD